MNVEKTEWQTLVLGPYDGDSYAYTFPCLPQVRTGHTKVFPPRSTLGPPDPNVDDTLSTLNFMDLTGGHGIARINVSTDLNMYWWGTADTRYADGWTPGPEVLGGTSAADLVTDATKVKPASSVGNCTPIGRIGDAMYALWGTQIHQWNPDTQAWTNTLGTIGTVVGDPVIFNDTAYFPLGASGYSYVSESASRTLGSITTVAGAATPSSNSPPPTTNPCVLLFGVHRQMLWAVTTLAQGYALASNVTGASGNWFWPYNIARSSFAKITTHALPRVLIDWQRPDGERALWCITKRGGLIFDDGENNWVETNLWDVPPHPNFGRAALPWRPGEALWISSGGGDAFQYTASNVAQPAQGPGGRRDGMPATRRGDIVSFTSDLANLYCLIKAGTIGDQTTLIEDEASDPLYLPSVSATTSLIANSGKGWVPLWETSEAPGVPTRVVVADPINTDNDTDYRVFWGIGEYCYSMVARLTSHSSRQGRQQGISRFAKRSYIEWGEFNAGSIAIKKLFSHVALLLDDASATEYIEYEYQTDADLSSTWHGTGLSGAVEQANSPNARTIFPFGISSDGLWSSGIANYWLKQRITLIGPGGVEAPTAQALSLAYMPLPADSAHQIYTIPLPVEVDERSGKTREQIYNLCRDLLVSEEMLYLKFQSRTYRAYVAGLQIAEIAGDDFVGAITLNVIQIPTGITSLLGEET